MYYQIRNFVFKFELGFNCMLLTSMECEFGFEYDYVKNVFNIF